MAHEKGEPMRKPRVLYVITRAERGGAATRDVRAVVHLRTVEPSRLPGQRDDRGDRRV